jgi:hypothetical protein
MCKIVTISNQDSAKPHLLPPRTKLCLLHLCRLCGLDVLLVLGLRVSRVRWHGGNGVARAQHTHVRHGRHHG